VIWSSNEKRRCTRSLGLLPTNGLHQSSELEINRDTRKQRNRKLPVSQSKKIENGGVPLFARLGVGHTAKDTGSVSTSDSYGGLVGCPSWSHKTGGGKKGGNWGYDGVPRKCGGNWVTGCCW